METINATGRRKTAVARIYVKEGKGDITINNKEFAAYFADFIFQKVVMEPLVLANLQGKFDIKVNLDGGGFKGQAEALRLAIARALVKHDPELRPLLKGDGLLSRDPRKVERKKPGQPKARKKFQFSKR